VAAALRSASHSAGPSAATVTMEHATTDKERRPPAARASNSRQPCRAAQLVSAWQKTAVHNRAQTLRRTLRSVRTASPGLPADGSVPLIRCATVGDKLG